MLSRKLHIGCFDCPVDGWINTDITPHIWITKVSGLPVLLHRLGKMDVRRLQQHREGIFRKVRHLDLGRKLPFADGSMDAVFSSHVFEHLPRGVLNGLLQELLRILRSGGVMRVAVPDLDYFIANYKPEAADEFVKAVFEIDHSNPKNRHHWMYNEHNLSKALCDAGFVNVQRRGYREGQCPDLELLDNRPLHSLFMEGERAP